MVGQVRIVLLQLLVFFFCNFSTTVLATKNEEKIHSDSAIYTINSNWKEYAGTNVTLGQSPVYQIKDLSCDESTESNEVQKKTKPSVVRSAQELK